MYWLNPSFRRRQVRIVHIPRFWVILKTSPSVMRVVVGSKTLSCFIAKKDCCHRKTIISLIRNPMERDNLVLISSICKIRDSLYGPLCYRSQQITLHLFKIIPTTASWKSVFTTLLKMALILMQKAILKTRVLLILASTLPRTNLTLSIADLRSWK